MNPILDFIDPYNEIFDFRMHRESCVRHYGNFLNIWHELSKNTEMEKNYDKMIGNIPELITYDKTIKPNYMQRMPIGLTLVRILLPFN